MIAATGHIVLKHRSEPHCRDAQFLKIVEMVGDALQRAAVARARVRPVYAVVKIGRLMLHVAAVGKAVGHHQVKHVGRVKTLVTCSVALTGKQFILLLDFALAAGKRDVDSARFGVAADGKIQKLIIRAVETRHGVKFHARAVDRRHSVAYALARNHYLQLLVFHPCPPHRWVHTVDSSFCVGCHCAGQKKSGNKKDFFHHR